jgi:uncharacterized membrane protein (UPF0127 family)
VIFPRGIASQRSTRGPVLAVVFAVSLGACQRTPEPAPPANVVEDHPAAKAVHVSAPSAPEARCVREAPATPPPGVSAATREQCPKDPVSAPALPLVPVTITTATGVVKVQAELAKAPAETERGLMYRMKMPDEQGMLFALGERREHPFWMHNTCIPLDMFWIDDDGLIVGVLENVPTLNDEERTIGCPSSWVLEVNAGWARRHGVRAGQKLTLPPH